MYPCYVGTKAILASSSALSVRTRSIVSGREIIPVFLFGNGLVLTRLTRGLVAMWATPTIWSACIRALLSTYTYTTLLI